MLPHGDRAFQQARAFLQAFPERAPDGDRVADAFQLRGERGVGLRKFLAGEARHLVDDVINARLEAAGARRSRRLNARINRTLEIFQRLTTIGH